MIVFAIESAENEGYTPKFLQEAFPEFTTDCWSNTTTVFAKWLKRDFPDIYEKTSYLKTYIEGY
jgi:hypothetical protein